jgi:hypothetical protein
VPERHGSLRLLNAGSRLARSEVNRRSSRILYCWNLSRFSKDFLAPLMPGMTTSVSRLTVHTIQVAVTDSGIGSIGTLNSRSAKVEL